MEKSNDSSELILFIATQSILPAPLVYKKWKLKIQFFTFVKE